MNALPPITTMSSALVAENVLTIWVPATVPSVVQICSIPPINLAKYEIAIEVSWKLKLLVGCGGRSEGPASPAMPDAGSLRDRLGDQRGSREGDRSGASFHSRRADLGFETSGRVDVAGIAKHLGWKCPSASAVRPVPV